MKKLGTIQVDMDSFRVILKSYNYEEDPAIPQRTIYQIAIPRFLELFNKYNIKATFFVIGEDLLKKENQAIIRWILGEGHEIANHTMTHSINPSFSSLTINEKEKEINQAEEIIREVTGFLPVGFKAPAYSIDNQTIAILEKKGYLYDSSLFPSSLPFVLRYMQRIMLRQKTGKTQWGRAIYVLAPLRPYRMRLDKIWKQGKSAKIKEVPVTTMPYLSLPFHASFVYAAGINLFKIGYRLVKSRNLPLNYQLHALELVGPEEMDKRILNKRPGAKMSLNKKLDIYNYILKNISKDYRIVTTKDFIQLV
ncbi:MAG: polysaccharide deacetylase family protein [Candidatus Omnitrophica bacterium]|nr:polysaccharide deacetylase family protein [Candidatus Omnitrophota bacterium]